jgi:hypothetical protein
MAQIAKIGGSPTAENPRLVYKSAPAAQPAMNPRTAGKAVNVLAV